MVGRDRHSALRTEVVFYEPNEQSGNRNPQKHYNGFGSRPNDCPSYRVFEFFLHKRVGLRTTSRISRNISMPETSATVSQASRWILAVSSESTNGPDRKTEALNVDIVYGTCCLDLLWG